MIVKSRLKHTFDICCFLLLIFFLLIGIQYGDVPAVQPAMEQPSTQLYFNVHNAPQHANIGRRYPRRRGATSPGAQSRAVRLQHIFPGDLFNTAYLRKTILSTIFY